MAGDLREIPEDTKHTLSDVEYTDSFSVARTFHILHLTPPGEIIGEMREIATSSYPRAALSSLRFSAR